MPKLARSRTQLQQQIADMLAEADFSGYADSMRQLLEKDRRAALAEIHAMTAQTVYTGAVRETSASKADACPEEYNGAGGLQDACLPMLTGNAHTKPAAE